LGADFSRHLGAELTLDFFERDYHYGPVGFIGEVSAWNVVPHVRLRRAVANRRLVPYVIAGIGPSFLQINDLSPNTFGREVDIEGWTFAISAGGGIEYYIADNVTFGVEGKYMYVNPIHGRINGDRVKVDMSSPMFTFGIRAYFDKDDRNDLIFNGEPAPNRFYAGVRVGGSGLTDKTWVHGVTLEPEASALWNTVNQTGGILFGVDLGRHFGIELAGDTVEQNIDVRGLGTIGEYSIGTIIPHARVRLPPIARRWSPYLFGGIGMAYGEFNDAKEIARGLDIDAKGFYPAIRVGAGIEYFMARNFSLSMDSYWLYTWGHDLQIPGVAGGKGDFGVFAVTVGFRVYLFEF
jgi:opacity protein-like surface antigen